MNTLEANAALATRATTSQFEPETKPPAAVSPAPVLITEKEVLFSTAAAVPLPTTTRWWPEATGVVVAAMHQMGLASKADGGQPRRDYPKRYEFLERSCMAREMDRL